MYDLSNYQRAELLAALPPATGEVHPLERMLEDVGSSAAKGKSQAFHHVHPRLPDMPPW